MEFKNGTAAQVPVVLVDATDNMTYETGITGPTVYAGKNGADTASVAGTSWLEPDATNNPGLYWLTIPLAFNDTDGPVMGTVTKAGCRPYHFAYEVVANLEADTYTRIGAPDGASIAADIAALPTDADVNAACDTALTDYDAPTKAELDSAVSPLALEATVAALHDFDPATDIVAHVTLVDTTTAVTEDIAADVDLTGIATATDVTNAVAGLATEAKQDAAQADLDTLTAVDTAAAVQSGMTAQGFTEALADGIGTPVQADDPRLDYLDAPVSEAGGGAEGDTLISQSTKLDEDGNIDPEGEALGIATPGSKLALYLATDTGYTDARRMTTAAANGTWSLLAPVGTWTLVVTLDGYYDAEDDDSAITRTVVIP